MKKIMQSPIFFILNIVIIGGYGYIIFKIFGEKWGFVLLSFLILIHLISIGVISSKINHKIKKELINTSNKKNIIKLFNNQSKTTIKIVNNFIKSYIKIKIKKDNIKEDNQLLSKFGGEPYSPKGFKYPQTKKGETMIFLGQINLTNIKEKIDIDIPKDGILQFFIEKNQTRDKEQEHKVIFHKTIKENKAINTTIKNQNNPRKIPFSEENVFYKLQFEKKYGLPNYESHEYSQLERKTGLKGFYEFYQDYIYPNNGQHQIGGYPKFTQFDPRNKKDNMILLFQFDSEIIDGKKGLIWGNGGVANFFITENDLKNKNFSKTFFTRDFF